MFTNKWFSSLSIKKEKGHLVGYYMTRYTLVTTLAFQNGRRTITNNHAY